MCQITKIPILMYSTAASLMLKPNAVTECVPFFRISTARLARAPPSPRHDRAGARRPAPLRYCSFDELPVVNFILISAEIIFVPYDLLGPALQRCW